MKTGTKYNTVISKPKHLTNNSEVVVFSFNQTKIYYYICEDLKSTDFFKKSNKNSLNIFRFSKSL